MTNRRDVIKGGLAAAGLGIIGMPDWVMPALAQGEMVIQFTDIPQNTRWEVPPDRRTLDGRTIDGPLTPADKWMTTQHYGHPEVDLAAHKLKISGEVAKPMQLTVDDLKKLGGTDIIAGFECSGNQGVTQGLASNGKWTGVPLRKVLDAAGLKPTGREIVFYGADKGEEEVEWRTQKFKLDVPFGRSLTRERALATDPMPMLVWALNGQPLTKHQGAPLRLLVPGWYGVANVKWLSQIHVQEDPYVGKYQARWYRTIRGEMIDGEMKYVENAVTHMNPKSWVAKLATTGKSCTVTGVILNDGSPIKSVEVKIDDGPWQPATLDAATAKDKYGWKLFNYTWKDPTPGDHTLISRITEMNGKVQPTVEELQTKKSFLEQNAQQPRKVHVG